MSYIDIDVCYFSIFLAQKKKQQWWKKDKKEYVQWYDDWRQRENWTIESKQQLYLYHLMNRMVYDNNEKSDNVDDDDLSLMFSDD